MSTRSKEIYEFSKFSLDIAERKLLREGKPVVLTDKAFDTLCVLVRRPGELVTKDEIMNSVWPDSVVEENNLDQKISMVRRALSEKGRAKEKFIETVRGHGYRFLPEVKVTSGVPSSSPVRPPSPISFGPNVSSSTVETRRDGNVVAVASWQKPKPSVELRAVSDDQAGMGNSSSPSSAADENRLWRSLGRHRVLQAGMLLILIGGISFLGWRLVSSSFGNAESDAVLDSIAVMPFVNGTGNPENDFLSDGLTESLIGSLSQIPGLSVKSRNSVFRYKGSEIDASSVGRELLVSGVLLGRFTQRGDNLLLGLELVDARTGNAIWAEQYDRRSSEIVSLQSEIARDVASKLRWRLSKADTDRIARAYTADADANRLYLQGMYHLNKRTAEDIRKSIELFEQATSRDPAYAKAHAGVAMSYLILPDYSHGLGRDVLRSYDEKFRAAFQKAFAVDSDLPESVLLSAAVKDIDWDVAGADREYRRAIELDPNFATARHWYSRFLGGLGRNEEALSQIYTARELDPYSRSIAFNVGARLADARRFDEAIEEYKRVLEMEPDHPLTHFGLALAYEAKGDYEAAIVEYQKSDVLLEKRSAGDAEQKARALKIAVDTGAGPGYWHRRLEFSRDEQEQGIGSDYNIAICLARLGRYDEALDKLEASLLNREPALFWIKTESAFDPMSNTPRFKNVLTQIGLPL
jgi:TolB-like protein/DNA-binding winged helix-turn-helix (wHTH) protein/Tfp pilus assembly protein PilF